MANYCLNFSTDKEKEAFNTLVKTVASYGLTEGLARVKVASYIEELSERYFTGKNKNKENVETATQKIMEDIIALSQKDKIGEKIVSNTFDLKNDTDINAVQTMIKAESAVIDKNTKPKKDTLYITRKIDDFRSAEGNYSDSFAAVTLKGKKNYIEFTKDTKQLNEDIKAALLSGKYKHLVIAQDVLGSMDEGQRNGLLNANFPNRQLPTNEEVQNALLKMRLGTRGYKENGIYAKVKVQDEEGRLREKQINFWSVQHKELWEVARNIRKTMREDNPNISNIDSIINQLETIDKPTDEADYYYSYDDKGELRESTLEKINNLQIRLENLPPDNQYTKVYKNKVIKELMDYMDPSNVNNKKHLDNLKYAIENDKKALDFLISTGYDKLTYNGEETDFSKTLTAIREIHRKGNNSAQYTYTSIDTDPRQPFNTLNTLAFKIANIKAPAKFEFGQEINYKSKSELSHIFSSREIADLTEALASAIDTWVMPLGNVNCLAYRQKKVILNKEIKKCQDIINSKDSTEDDRNIAQEKINIINTKLENFKKYTPEQWIEELGGIEELAKNVYRYSFSSNAAFLNDAKVLAQARYTEENINNLIEKRTELLSKMDDNLFKELFTSALGKTISLNNYILDQRFRDININESESEETENLEESGYADPGINKPAFTSNLASTVTKEVRMALSKIPLITSTGDPELDIIGNLKFLNFTSAYGKIQDICSDRLITTSEDVIKAMEDNLQTEPWLRNVISLLRSDSKLAAKFTNAFNVDFIKSVDQSDFKETALNMRSGSVSLINTWTRNIQEDNYISDKTVFDAGGRVSPEKAGEINTKNLIKPENIEDALYAVGIKNIPSEKLNALSTIHKKSILNKVNSIIQNVKKADKNSNKNIQADNRSLYIDLARILANQIHTESADSSFNVTKNGKIVQQFSYTYNSKIARMSQKIDGAFESHNTEDITGANLMIDSLSSPLLNAVLLQDKNNENYGELTYVVTMGGQEISDVANGDVYYRNAFYQYIKDRETESANYYIAPLSDSGNILSIRMPKISLTKEYQKGNSGDFLMMNEESITGRDLLNTYIKNAITQELTRIIRVREESTPLIKVKSYKKAGEHFHKLPMLDAYIDEMINKYQTSKTNDEYEDYLDNLLFGEGGIITELTQEAVIDLSQALEDKLTGNKYTEQDIEEFFLNNLLAQWNINDIMFKDMAFFKYNGVSSTADFIKRIKGLFGRTTKGDIAQLEDPNCRMAYVKFGIHEQHPLQQYAENILANSSIAGTTEAKVIEKVWKDKIEGADGQGFLTVKGLKAWGKLYGYDSDYIEGFIERAKNQQLTPEDYNFVFSVKKPYVYTFVRDPESGQDIPTIVKNSLGLLIPGLTPPNTIYDALMKFAEKNDLDQIQLDSAIKIGGNHIFDIDEIMKNNPNITSEELYVKMEQTKETWDEESGLTGSDQSSAIHEIPYEDFGEQTRTETQHDKIKLGIQVMKVMFSDIKDEAAIAGKFNGKNLNGTEFKNIYLSALAAKLNMNYNKVAGIFAESSTLEQALKSLAISSGKFTQNDFQDIDLSQQDVLLGALAPTHLNKYYTLVRGLAKHIAEVNVPGKTMIQMSGVAYDEDLHIIFEDENGKEIVSNKDNIGLIQELFKVGKIRIKSLEAYCGVYNNDLFKAVLNENGIIDEEAFNKLPEEVKMFMAYRVPTEGNCSVFPCKIKKFLNRYAGDTIVLPKEIVLLTGSDFDVDKDFCHFPEINVEEHNDARTAYEIYKQEMNEKYGPIAKMNMLSFDNWVMQHKDKYSFKVSKVKYDTEGDVAEKLRNGEYSDRQINNILFDLHIARLQAQDSTHNMFVSSNFEMVKKISNLMVIANNIHNINDEDIKNIKNEKLRDIVQRFKQALKEDSNIVLRDASQRGVKILKVFNDLWNNADLLEKEALCVEENSKILPIADIREMWRNLDQNSQGSSIIGRFAILKATLSQIQGSGMKINNAYAIALDGINYDNISDISVKESTLLKNFIAAQFLAASVDNGKDPRAGKLNINSITINTVTTMIALGMPMEKIALIMAHPAIKALTEVCKKTGMRFSASTLAEVVESFSYTPGLTSGQLLSDIVTGNNDSSKNVLGLMHRVMLISDDMTKLTMALRSDKASAGLPSLSIYSAVNTVRSTRKFIKDLNNGNTVFTFPKNGSNLFENLDYIATQNNVLTTLKDNLGEEGFGQNRAYPNFFRLFGTILPYQLMSEKFFETSDNAETVLNHVESLLGINLYENDIKNVLQAWVRYNMMKLPTFADEYDEEGNLTQSSSDKFELFLKGFPSHFVKTAMKLKELPEFKDNYILSNIGKYVAGSNRLAVNQLNKIDKNTIEQAQNAWKELLESKDKKARDLGLGLYTYMLYTNGGYFEGVGYSQFSTADMTALIPGYTKMLQSLSKNDIDPEDLINFVVQAAANNVVDVKKATDKSPYKVNNTYEKTEGEDTLQIMNTSKEATPLLLKVSTKEEGEKKATLKLYMRVKESDPYITMKSDNCYPQYIYKKVPQIKYEGNTLNMNPSVKWNEGEFEDRRLRPVSKKVNGTAYALEKDTNIKLSDIEVNEMYDPSAYDSNNVDIQESANDYASLDFDIPTDNNAVVEMLKEKAKKGSTESYEKLLAYDKKAAEEVENEYKIACKIQ